MRTPINNNGCRNVIDPNVDFHAGHFLCDVLQEEGHDMSWLANRLNVLLKLLNCILEQPNRDAELFEQRGKPMDSVFMQRLDEMSMETPV